MEERPINIDRLAGPKFERHLTEPNPTTGITAGALLRELNTKLREIGAGDSWLMFEAQAVQARTAMKPSVNPVSEVVGMIQLAVKANLLGPQTNLDQIGTSNRIDIDTTNAAAVRQAISALTKEGCTQAFTWRKSVPSNV